MSLSLRSIFVAGLFVLAMSSHEAEAGGVSFYYGPTYAAGYYPAPVYSYPVYAPVTVYRPIIQPVYVAPVYQPVVRPVVPVVYEAPAYGYPTRVRYKRREIETKVYTPYGTYETEVKYDRWGNVRDVDFDLDD